MTIQFGFSFFMSLLAAIIMMFLPSANVEAATVNVDLQYIQEDQGYHQVGMYLNSDSDITLQLMNIAFSITPGTSHLEDYKWGYPFYPMSDWMGGDEFVVFSTREIKQLDSTPFLAMLFVLDDDTTLSVIDGLSNAQSQFDMTYFLADGEKVDYSLDSIYVPEPAIASMMLLGGLIILRRQRK